MASKKELRALITLAGKIDPSLQTAMLKASKMNMKLSEGAKKSGSLLSKVGTIAKGVFVGNLATQAFSRITGGIIAVGSNGIKLASDLQEVQNVVDTTFTTSANQINTWSKQALNAFGLSELQAKQFAGTMGAMLKSSSIAGKNMLVMSQNLAGLAGDFASFYNLSQKEAFEKIRAGISGETEPLKQLGINMSVANLEAYALSKGIKTAYKDMDQASQVMLRYSYLMSVSKDAQGDFVKTQDSFANQTRLLKTNWEQFTATIGKKALPIITKLIGYGNKLLGGIDAEKLGDLVGNKLTAAFDTVAQYAPIVIDNIKKIPPVVSEIYDKVKWAADLIINNWPMIEPIVWGITGALVANKIAMWGMVAAQKAGMIIQGLSKAWQVGTAILGMFRAGASVATIAQWAFNAALSANPIGLVVVGIGALIAVGVLLYKNWNAITAALSNAWNWFTNLIKGMPDVALALTGPLAPLLLLIKHFDKVKELAGKAFDAVKKFFGFGGKEGDKTSAGNGQSVISYGMKKYAKGGFADEPSIFGDDGLEAAIPIKYRNPRSISLLNKVAQAIGVTPAGGTMVQLTYAPVIYGGNRAEIEPLLQQHKEELRAMIEDIIAGNRRVAFG